VQGREDIAKQTQLIAELTRAGYDIQAATELLNTLHQSQALLVEHRDQLRRELGLALTLVNGAGEPVGVQ
jgi:hypothetical protein